MSFEKPDIARGLRQTKTVTDSEIVASNEARRRTKLRAMKQVRVKMGIKEKYDEKEIQNGTKGSRNKGRANVKRCKTCVRKKVKKAQTCKKNQYEHISWRSKPCDNMENDRHWKRYNQRDDTTLLSGRGLET